MSIKRLAITIALFTLLAGVTLGMFPSHVVQAAAPSVATKPTTLNVIVAGGFVCLFDHQQVRVIAPRVEHHLYKIAGEDIKPATYYLHGVTGLDDASQITYELPPGAEHFQFSASSQDVAWGREKEAYFSLVLPLPKRIVALHTRRAEIVDALGNKRTVTMPTSYAFVYDVTDAEHMGLTPSTEWKPQSSLGQSEYTNLVVGTGTRDDSQEHVQSAWSQLMSYVPGSKVQILDISREERVADLRGYPGPTARGPQPGDCFIGPILIKIIDLLTPKGK